MTTGKNTAKNRKKTARLKRKSDAAREALIKAAVYVLRYTDGALTINEIVRLMAQYDQGHTTARKLSAALRVARREERVTYDGRVYGLPAAVEEPAPALVREVSFSATPAKPTVPAWVRDGQRVRGISEASRGREGVLRRVSTGIVIEGAGWHHAAAVLHEIGEDWAPVGAALPAWVQQDTPVLGIGEQEGKAGRLRRIGVERWAVLGHPDRIVWVGDADLVAARWRPLVDPTATPGAARDLAERQAFGGRASTVTLQSVEADERAPVPTEAAERIAALEARAAKYAATIVELTMRLIASEKARAA